MLQETILNPTVRQQRLLEKTVQVKNRPVWLGNDETGLTSHFNSLEINTFNDLTPVARKNHLTWSNMKALRAFRPHGLKLSELVRTDRCPDFWFVYNTLRRDGASRKDIITFIKKFGTSE